MCVCVCKRVYDTSLTDAQWAVIEPLLPVRDPSRGGRPLKYGRRLIIDTVLYVLGSGCAWRMVPRDLAPWDAAYRWFRLWSADGTWDRLHDALRDRVRIADGRDPQPSAAVLDSQSARSHQGGEAIGYDAGKRVRGRKRHILVDTCGLVLRAVVHSASVQDRAGAKRVLTGLHTLFPRVGLVWVDGGYVNRVDAGLVGWARHAENVEIVAVPRNADVKGFQVLPRRWVVERTFSWLGRCRRLARDYERKTAHAEAMIKVAMIRLMAARLAGEAVTPHGPIETEAARRLADDLKNE
ncbi:IS5 family transposase [Streptomyces physcomitrii]|uniref:IS5 family transposase n=1 Tax=Streptomyces physcomitrii TaxID=2724184 RepID=A0ABX1HBK5_9ACTN|nr:IS5 family transposase [Streptomyces physcomitrii]NKI44629.1 IS5 family transposase [Streptomyces physcomitrii]